MKSLTSTKFPSQSSSTQGRNPKQVAESEEPGKKPKKVTSEIRKQQNRVASRNYREKRKRKLQFLQQVVENSSNDEQESALSPGQYEVSARSLSADTEGAGPSPYLYVMQSDSTFESTNSSSSAAVSDPLLTASAASFDHRLATTQVYSTLGPNSNAPIYSPPPPANMAWGIPHWEPSADYPPPVVPHPEVYHYTPPPGQTTFEQAYLSSQYPRDLLSNVKLYTLSYSPYDSQSQTHSRPNVSMPTSSSYHQGYYPGPH